MNHSDPKTVCKAAFNSLSPCADLSLCIDKIESALRGVPETPFHAVLGKTFSPLTDALAEYMISYRNACAAIATVESVYFEMNGFAHNTHGWLCNGFCLTEYQGFEDGYQWVAEYGIEDGDDFYLTLSESYHDNRQGRPRDENRDHLTEMDEVRFIYDTFSHPGKNWERGKTDHEETASIFSDYLIIARFNQLVAAAHAKAAKRTEQFSDLPVLCTAHDAPDWTVYETRR